MPLKNSERRVVMPPVYGYTGRAVLYVLALSVIFIRRKIVKVFEKRAELERVQIYLTSGRNTSGRQCIAWPICPLYPLTTATSILARRDAQHSFEVAIQVALVGETYRGRDLCQRY